MPELPEVETTLRGIEPHVAGCLVTAVTVREGRLRWPVPATIQRAVGRRVDRLSRRGKYLLFGLGDGGLLIHLGMSGALRVLDHGAAPGKHDHVDVEMDNGLLLRFNDPRRFGAVLWTEGDPARHELLSHLGPEPLCAGFTAAHLYRASRGRRLAVKSFIMDARVVVGVGNIYASESLFMAGIHPKRAAGRVSRARYEGLVEAIRDVLARAIRQGGTTLRDFVGSDGAPGYFAQELLVYDREGKPCFQCGGPIRRAVIGQRSSYFCPSCQT